MPTLNVLLVCGNNLVAKDSNGKSDPYVYLTVGGTTRKSSTKISTLNPTYNEHFTFPVHNPTVDTLKIQVYDYDIIGANDPMGSCVVSLATLVRGRPTRQTHTLGGVRHGNITLELTAVDFGGAFPPTPHAHAHHHHPPHAHQAYPPHHQPPHQAYPPQPHQAYPPQPSHQAYPPPQAYPPQQPYPPQPSHQAYPPQPAYGAPPQPAYGAPPVYGGAPPPSSGYPVSSAPAYGYPGPQPAYGHHTVVMAGHGGKHKHKHKKHKKHKGFKAKKFFKKGFKKGFF